MSKISKTADKKINAFCIAGTNSGAGKTVITLALIKAFSNIGMRVQPFKCGPDYIDTEFHTDAAGTPSYNLDTWMMGNEEIKNTFSRNIQNRDMAIVEGVMGLFDGASSETLEGSSAAVAKYLDIPIILIVNAKSMAQSIAAVVKGYHTLYPGITISGVIANNVGSEKHKKILTEALKYHNLPELIGTIPKNDAFKLPERHLGLTASAELKKDQKWLNRIAEIIAENIDLNALLRITETNKPECSQTPDPISCTPLRLAIANDEVFHFYYQDNLDLLEKYGFELIKFSPLNDNKLPKNIHAVYIGGGFPENFADRLSSNKSMISSLKNFADNNGVIFAECGGYMYLADSFITSDNKKLPMCGIMEGDGIMKDRLQNFGYKKIVLDKPTLFGNKGTMFKGHEFHWSVINNENLKNHLFLTQNLHSGEHCKAGQIYRNVFASYVHIHFLSNPHLIPHFRKFIENNRNNQKCQMA